jgi:D-threo-aldose 1-dehydrogenase
MYTGNATIWLRGRKCRQAARMPLPPRSFCQNQRMQRVTLGMTGVVSSALGFGTSSLIRIPGRRKRQDVLAAAFAAGLTHFDTAPIYGLGESERELGRFMGGRRAQCTVTTKFGLAVSPVAAFLAPGQRLARRLFEAFPGLRKPAGRSGRRALYGQPSFTVGAVRASLERSLRSLRTDYVDFFLAHECSVDNTPAGEVLEFLEAARVAGRIRDYGIAASYARTQSLLAARSDLGRVIQFDSDFFEPHAQQFVKPSPAAALITHSAVARAAPRLRALFRTRPQVAQRFLGEFGLAPGDAATIGSLLLRAAILANRDGVVLMQSSSPAHIGHNARAAGCASADAAIRCLREFVDADVSRDN